MSAITGILRQKKNNLSVHTVEMGLKLNGPPNKTIHILGLGGKEGGSGKLDAVYQVHAVFRYNMFLQPGVNWKAHLLNANHTALTRDCPSATFSTDPI
jgi:hypothetical protein